MRANRVGAVFSVFLWTVFLCTSVYADNILGPKYGNVNWGQNSFTVSGQRVDIFSESHPIGFEYNFLFSSGFATGVGFSLQTLHLIGADYASVYRSFLTEKYYLPLVDNVRPFFGGAFGNARIHIHGKGNEPSATLSGPVRSAIAGVKVQLASRLSLSFEYRLSKVSVSDFGNNYDSTNKEYYFLLSFNRESPY